MMNNADTQPTGRPRTSAWLVSALVWTLAAATVAPAAPPLDALPTPDYSFDAGSPSVLEGHVLAADGLALAFPYPAATLPGAWLGLMSTTDDIDALSAANTTVHADTVFAILFSVDRASTGDVAPSNDLQQSGIPYNVSDQALRGHAAGDQYATTKMFTSAGTSTADLVEPANNSLVRNNFDEGGTDFGGWPPTHAHSIVEALPQDRVDATAQLDRTAAGDAVVELYFSLTATSPSMPLRQPLNETPASGANIYFAYDRESRPATCCLPDGTCEALPELPCMAEGGWWAGLDATCDVCAVDDEQGACCFGDGLCDMAEEEGCYTPGVWGRWLGPGTTCDMCDVPESDGACCFVGDSSCAVTTEWDCFDPMTGFGIWLGPDTTCDTCDFRFASGACCTNDSCTLTPSDGCRDGVWLGAGTTCDLCIAPEETGACCNLHDTTCQVTSMTTCDEDDGFELWMGPDTTCDMCPVIPRDGACCHEDLTCDITTPEDCVDGLFAGFDTDCGACPATEALGACCAGDDTCQRTSEWACTATGTWASWLGPGTSCDMCLPGEPGACCVDEDGCLDMDAFSCTLMAGTFHPHRNCQWDGDDHRPDSACLDAIMTVQLYASHEQLGLQQADDIDALIVFDRNANGLFDGDDQVLFSLTPQSPSLTSTLDSAGTADIFTVSPGTQPTVYAVGADLGLGGAQDNVDALDLLPVAPSLLHSGPQTDYLTRHGIRAPKAKKRILNERLQARPAALKRSTRKP